ncbi:universal stress protein [Nonomuraea sp. NPDC046570]|uniref:universal stress protein n=1 Tax=Nonomuraea sp. NPDC046570 TaxID=3155255 RepID=UPI0033E9A482
MIVVGVDGSRVALEAVVWAVREAAIRDDTVRIVYAIPAWAYEMCEGPARAGMSRRMRDAMLDVLTVAVRRARVESADVDVDSQLLPGDPPLVLIRTSKDAELLVVGDHTGGNSHGLLGSVVPGVSSQATCPVAVVHTVPARPRNEVVVGVDGSPGAQAAVEFAFAEAALRKAELHAVHAWDRDTAGCGAEGMPGLTQQAAVERRLLAEAVAGFGERYPDVKVVESTDQGHPVEVLRKASSAAGLLVVGSRGWGSGPALLLGSVSRMLLQRVICPLIVVATADTV